MALCGFTTMDRVRYIRGSAAPRGWVGGRPVRSLRAGFRRRPCQRAGTRDPPLVRGARHRRWALGFRRRLLAGRCGVRRRRRREEALPQGEDLRRRADAALGAPARGHGARRRSHPLPPLRGSARPRLRPRAPLALAQAPRFRGVRLRHYPGRARRPRRPPRREGGRHGARGLRGARAPRPRGGQRRPGARRFRSGTRRRHDATRSPPASSSSPTARTRGSAGPSAPARDRAVPQGMAIRGYFSSPRHDETWIESHLDLRDDTGEVIPGYGWVFPLGDGRVNVGIGIVSSVRPLEVDEHDAADGLLRRPGAGVVVPFPGERARRADRGPAADGTLGRPPPGAGLRPRRRRRRRHQPVQR